MGDTILRTLVGGGGGGGSATDITGLQKTGTATFVAGVAKQLTFGTAFDATKFAAKGYTVKIFNQSGSNIQDMALTDVLATGCKVTLQESGTFDFEVTLRTE
jgi:hypothetical protein